MKKAIIALFLGGVASMSTAFGQNADPVVMTIAGQDVARSEFEYFYNKNNDAREKNGETSSVDKYVDLFVNYKLKVQAAKDAKIDTLSSFIKEYRTYRDMQLRPYLQDREFVDSLTAAVYDNMQKQIGDSDLLHVRQIMMVVPQKSSDKLREEKKVRIDSIYQALKEGADFETLAKKCSEDYTTSQQGGELPWFGPNQTLPEFEKVAYSLKNGEYSEPFLSSVGYHILYMVERKKLEPYEEKKDEIEKLLEPRGLKEMAAEHKIRRLVEESKGKLTREDVVTKVQNDACQNNNSLRYLINEYHDGLLLYEVCNRLVWKKAAEDNAGLEKYFKKNKKKYYWDEPRFKGFLIHARSQSMLDKASKFLKAHDDEEGVKAFNQNLPKDSVKSVRAKFGVYKAGEDIYVDYHVYKKQAPKPNKLYPYNNVVGKMLKNPKSYKDVKAQVVSDYQDAKEKEWLDDLHKKYTVKVNREVLKTVNNH